METHMSRPPLQDPARSRRIALILAVLAVAFYVGTFLFWAPKP